MGESGCKEGRDGRRERKRGRRGSEVGLKRKEIKECHQSGLKATEGGAASLASLPLTLHSGNIGKVR